MFCGIIGFTFLSSCKTLPIPLVINGDYIGGYYKADTSKWLQYKNRPTYVDITVNNVEELLSELKKAARGTTIFLAGDSAFDLSGYRNVSIPAGVTLASDRGINKSKGALIYTDNLSSSPLFQVTGDDVKIMGLRLQGPDSNVVHPRVIKEKRDLGREDPRSGLSEARFKTYGVPNSSGIKVNEYKNLTVENCEIYFWSHAGIEVSNNSTAFIHHSYIHHNQRVGLGYGIVVDQAHALIKANIFDYNRHAIAGTGRLGTSYIAEYNISLSNSTNQGHVFDMHGGVDRNDGTNLAGDYVSVSNNIFYYKNFPVIKVRGVSLKKSIISNNTFIKADLGGNPNVDRVILQSGGKRGNLERVNNRFR